MYCTLAIPTRTYLHVTHKLMICCRTKKIRIDLTMHYYYSILNVSTKSTLLLLLHNKSFNVPQSTRIIQD